MCGIAGFSIGSSVGIDVPAFVRLLIAGLAERGEDACGFAWRDASGRIEVVKASMPPLEFLARVPIVIPFDAREVIVHVRDYTKGRPSNVANNHPIRHGRFVGVHNGIIQNDDELFASHGRLRAEEGMTVDSEAIFMLLDVHQGSDAAWPELVGSYSTAFLDAQEDRGLHLVRGSGRPLVMGTSPGIMAFASTRHALEFASSRLDLSLDAHGVPSGRRMLLLDGGIVDDHPIEVTPFSEGEPTSYERNTPSAVHARNLAIDQLDVGNAASDGGQQSA